MSIRHKCFACYKQFKKKEHLVEHMKISYHSPHEPTCGVCQKHCKSFESLRAHLTGPLARESCSKIFSDRGCDLCLNVYDSTSSLDKHRETCPLSAPASLGAKILPFEGSTDEEHSARTAGAIAIDCVLVGGGPDGSLDLCARVCLVDEDENVIFHSYVQPQTTVLDYRYEITGLAEEHLRNSMPLNEVRETVLKILYNGESAGRLRSNCGKARLLVGHELKCDLDCLRISYPGHLLRYDIQTGEHDPYVNCISVMRLYERMRVQDHCIGGIGSPDSCSGFDSWKPEQLKNMKPDELYTISKSDCRCWCLDSRQAAGLNN